MESPERFEDHYPELRRIAAQMMRCERPGHTLGATDLVHEAWVRLADHLRESGRADPALIHRVMLNRLVDHARRRHADKRGGGKHRSEVDMDALELTGDGPSAEDVLAIHEAMERLAADDETSFTVVSMRVFRRLRMAEIATELGLTDHEVRMRWDYGKARLRMWMAG
jgi:RNA polymerase sigma factor (TIGR02999 family)